MEKVVVEAPDELVAQYDQYRDRLGDIIFLGLLQLKIHEALLFYRRGIASLGRAAELAGVSGEEMIRQARAAGVEPRWSERMVEDGLERSSHTTPIPTD